MAHIPAKRQSLPAWIEQNVRLPAGIAAAPGPIKLYPYQRAIADPKVERISVLNRRELVSGASASRPA